MRVQRLAGFQMDRVCAVRIDDLRVERSRGSIHCQSARLIHPDSHSRGGA
jgi:hypothetical protein